MANFIYDSAREQFLNGEISWQNDDIRALLIKNDLYSSSSAAETTHKSLVDIDAQSILQVSHPLQNKSSEKGIAYSSPVLFSDVPGGENVRITSIILFKQGISKLQSFLIAHIDVDLQVQTTQDVTIQWNTTGNKIFKL